MAEERKATDEVFEEVTGSDILMQSILGKLYAIITTGSEVVTGKTDNFLAWASPGYPVCPEDFDFAYLGISGETIDLDELQARCETEIDRIKKFRKDTGQETVEIDYESLIAEQRELLKLETQQRRRSAANDFATLVDFIPDVSGTDQQSFNVLYNEDGLSDVYKMALQMSQVRRRILSEQDKEILENANLLLGEKVEVIEDKPQEETTSDEDSEAAAIAAIFAKMKGNQKEDDVDDSEESVKVVAPKMKVTKSPYMEKYDRYKDAYEAAAVEYSNALYDGTLGTFEQRAKWAQGTIARFARQKLEDAMEDWKGPGLKNEIDTIRAQRDAIQERDFSVIKNDYKKLFVHSMLNNEKREFLDTTLSPAKFVKSGGWTHFTFSKSELKEYSKEKYHAHSKAIKTKTGSIFHRTNTTNTKESRSYDLEQELKTKNFELSFDFCQVRIIRPWFKESFLNSSYWRFVPGEEKCLSDGKNPPQGILPAYPTSVLFIRNLNLKYGNSDDYAKLDKTYKSKSADYSGGLRFGWFNISAGAGYADSDTKFKNDWEHNYTCDSQGITVPGMQIIGFNCHLLGKSPDPDPKVPENEWI
jgi:hypothetical protein